MIFTILNFLVLMGSYGVLSDLRKLMTAMSEKESNVFVTNYSESPEKPNG